MADSTFVFPPGWFATDTDTRAPVSGAVLKFYDAGTTTPKTVYSDKDLSVEIGTSVTCDALGYPTSDGTSTKTLIYVGTKAYKVRCEDADGNLLFEHDNIVGAVSIPDTDDVSVTAKFPVLVKSLDYTVLKTDQNATILANCSSGDVSLTLPSATDDDVPSGWAVRVQHAGSANQVIVKTVSDQTISEGSKSFGEQFVLALNGEDCLIVCDDGGWRVVAHTTPFIKVAQGIIPVADRLSSPPDTPEAGAFYILTSSPSGDWEDFAESDVVQYTGAAWVNFTPYTDCGWTAYVQDEDINYQFKASAWVSEVGTTAAWGNVALATQAQMEAVTGTVARAVTPDVQQYHPGHPKFWLRATVTSGVPAISDSYNVTSVTDTAQGDLTVTIATDFSSANWCPLPGLIAGGSALPCSVKTSPTAGTVELVTRQLDGGSTDPSGWTVAGLGDQ